MPTQTAAQKRAIARKAYDAYLQTCPSRQLLERIGNKWVTLVVSALGDGSERFSTLSRSIAGVSQKMLAQTLRDLERDGLVERTVTPLVPVRVDYALTPLGHSLLDLVRQIKQWSELHMPDVLLARAHHDRRSAGLSSGSGRRA